MHYQGRLGCIVSGLTNSTPYTFTVTATNANGTGNPSVATGSVSPLAVPDAPVVTATGGVGTALVSWIPPSGTITGYTVTSSPGGLTCPTGPSTTSCTVAGLNNGTWYTFSVTATNGVGTGLPGTVGPGPGRAQPGALQRR